MSIVWWWALLSALAGRGSGWVSPMDLSQPVMPDSGIHLRENVPGNAQGVAFAYDPVDQVYLAVWHDQRDGTWKLYATLLKPDGTELTPGGFLLYDGVANWPDVIFDGTHFLVAFTSYVYDATYGDIFAMRVAPDGQVLDPGGFLVAQGVLSPYGVQMARIGDKVLAVWHDYYNSGYANWFVAGALLTTDGNVERVLTIGDAVYYQEWPVVAADGSRFLVCWMDYRSGARWDIYCNFVDTTGATSDGTPGFGLAAAGGVQQIYPDVAYNAQLGEYLVVWEANFGGYYQIYGKRVLPNHTVLDPSAVRLGQTTAQQYNPGVLAGPDTLFTILVSADYRNGAAGDAYAFRVRGDLTRVDSPAVALATQPLEEGHWTPHPPVAMDPTGLLFGWAYGPTGNVPPTAVQVVRRSLDLSQDLWGGVRDLDWQSGPQRSLVMARASDRVLAVWSAPDSTGDWQIWGRLYTPAGHALSGVFLVSNASGAQQYPQAVYDARSGNFLVVWEDFRNGVDWDIFGARVDTQGTVLDPAGLALVSVNGHQMEPALAVSDTTVPRFFLVWSDNRAGNWNILGKFYNEFGVPTTGDLSIGVAGNTQEKARVVYAPQQREFFVVWEDYRNNRWDVYENRVDLSGSPILGAGGRPLYAAGSQNRRPDVVWTGSRYLVAWEDSRNGTWDIYVARVSPTGQRMDPVGIPVVTAAAAQRSVRLAWLQGHALAVWQDARNGGNDLYGTLLDASGQPDLPGGQRLVSSLGVTGALAASPEYPNWVASLLPLSDSTFALAYEQVQGAPYHNRRVVFRLFRDHAPALVFQPTDTAFLVGDTVVLRWSTRGVLEQVTLEGSPDGITWTAFATGQPNAGSLQVVLPDQPSRTYRFRLTATGPWQTQVVSAPVVLLHRPDWVVPAAGDTLQLGGFVTLNWTPTGVGGTVQLELSQDGGNTWTVIHSFVPDTGGFTWTVSGTPTDQAMFRVVHTGYPLAQAEVGPVVIRSNAALTLLNPNGGDTLFVGDTLTVQWSAVGVQQVALLLSPDSGLTYLTVAPALDAAAGGYAWVVPDHPTPYGKMRVQDVSQPALFDESDAFFAVLQPALMMYPNGGEVVDGAQPLTIQWQLLRADLVDTVDVYFSQDDGRTWTRVGTSIPASAGQYTFAVPNQNLDSCRVEIRHHRRGWLIHDASDGRFRIQRGVGVAERPAAFRLRLLRVQQRQVLTVALPQSDRLQVTVRDLLGRTLWQRTWSLRAGRHTLRLPILPAGVYVLKVDSRTVHRTLRWVQF